MTTGSYFETSSIQQLDIVGLGDKKSIRLAEIVNAQSQRILFERRSSSLTSTHLQTNRNVTRKPKALSAVIRSRHKWGTGIRGLMRGMATLPQGNQELLVVTDKVGRPPGELGVSK